MINKLYSWIAKRLPARLIDYCILRVFIETTTGKYSYTEVPALTLMEAWQRWARIYAIRNHKRLSKKQLIKLKEELKTT